MPAVAARSFDSDRDASERLLARRRVDDRGKSKGVFGADRDECVQRGVKTVDPVERELNELGRADLSTANEPRLLDGREERELHRGDATSRGIADYELGKAGRSPT